KFKNSALVTRRLCCFFTGLPSKMLVQTVVSIAPLIFVGALSGCVSPDRRQSSGAVRKVDYSRAPEMKVFADRARQIANEKYPVIVAILVNAPSEAPRQFEIV